MDSVGSLQVCAGQDAGCEAAIHALRDIYEQEECEAVMLIDASNAFNSVNRKAFLHNVKIICPLIATFTTNCYSSSSRLFVVGGTEILSSEGTIQGDPIAGLVYAIAIIPMILRAVQIFNIKIPTPRQQRMRMTYLEEANYMDYASCGIY